LTVKIQGAKIQKDNHNTKENASIILMHFP